MAKWSNDSVMDAALDKIATGVTITVTTQQPTTRAEAVTTYKLATRTVTGAAYTKANGDISGRKVTIAQQENISVDTTGTATHIAISDATNLLYVTTCTSQLLTAGNTITIPAWKAEFADPS